MPITFKMQKVSGLKLPARRNMVGASERVAGDHSPNYFYAVKAVLWAISQRLSGHLLFKTRHSGQRLLPTRCICTTDQHQFDCCSVGLAKFGRGAPERYCEQPDVGAESASSPGKSLTVAGHRDVHAAGIAHPSGGGY